MDGLEQLFNEHVELIANAAKAYAILCRKRDDFYAVRDRVLPETIQIAEDLKRAAQEYIKNVPEQVRRVIAESEDLYIEAAEGVINRRPQSQTP